MATLIHKKWPLVVAALAITLISGTSVAYVLYSKPEKVLGDALQKTISAHSLDAQGTLNVKDQNDTAAIAFTLNARAVGLSQSDADVKAKTGGQDFTMKGSLITDQKDFYVKLNNVQPAIDAVVGTLGVDTQSAQPIFANLVKMINNKWVSITRPEVYDLLQVSADERQRQDKEYACTQKTYQDFINQKTLQEPVYKLYKQHQFIAVDEDLGIDTVAGRASHHYQLKYDTTKGGEFVDGLVETPIFKRIDDCFASDLKAQYKDQAQQAKKDSSASNTTKTEVWIDRWNHEPTRLRLTIKDGTEDATIDSNLTLNKAAEVAKPVIDTTLKQLVDEFSRISSQLFGATVVGVEKKGEDTERQTDINALQGQLEAFYASNGFYPTLADLNNPAWRATNNFKVDPEALRDPSGTAYTLASTPQTGFYTYSPVRGTSATCTSGECTAYTLSAQLHDGTAFTRSSL